MAVFTDTSEKDVAILYAAIFGRLPDGSGLAYWKYMTTANNWDMRTLAENMLYAAVNDPRTKDFYADYFDDVKYVTAIYKNVFGKTFADDPDGIMYWVNELRQGKTKKGEVVAHIIYAAITKHKDDPATKALLNRAEAGVLFASQFKEADIDGDGKVDLDIFRNALLLVTDDPNTVEKATTYAGEATGEEFYLTTNIDVIKGTKGNDRIYGYIGSNKST
ncbi:MAG: DUF4214 domain-containing protein, partial [Archaeoglobaceae archaeon]